MPTRAIGIKKGNEDRDENQEFLIPSEELKCSP